MTENNQGQPKEAPPPELFGITEADFNGWKHHPVTKAFRQFIEQQRDEHRQNAILRWEQGETDPIYEAESRSECNTLSNLLELTFEAMMVLSGRGDEIIEEETDETTTV